MLNLEASNCERANRSKASLEIAAESAGTRMEPSCYSARGSEPSIRGMDLCDELVVKMRPPQ